MNSYPQSKKYVYLSTLFSYYLIVKIFSYHTLYYSLFLGHHCEQGILEDNVVVVRVVNSARKSEMKKMEVDEAIVRYNRDT